MHSAWSNLLGKFVQGGIPLDTVDMADYRPDVKRDFCVWDGRACLCQATSSVAAVDGELLRRSVSNLLVAVASYGPVACSVSGDLTTQRLTTLLGLPNLRGPPAARASTSVRVWTDWYTVLAWMTRRSSWHPAEKVITIVNGKKLDSLKCVQGRQSLTSRTNIVFVTLPQGRLHHRKLGANAPKNFRGGRFDVEPGGGNVFEKKYLQTSCCYFFW